MAWIESHTILTRHRKLVFMAKELRLKPVYLMGHLHALWHAAMEQQEDGDLSSWTDEIIAEYAQFQGDAPQFVSLLQKYRWLDGKLIHDWLEYAGKYLESKYRSSNYNRLINIWEKHGLIYDKAPARQMKAGWNKIRDEILKRDDYKCHYCSEKSEFMEVDHVLAVENGGTDDLSNLVACCRSCNRKKGDKAILKPDSSQTKASPPNLPNLPNLPNQNTYAQQAARLRIIFDEFWDKYPKKLGRKSAQRHFNASVKTDDDVSLFKKAFDAFLHSKVAHGDSQFIPHGSTWFNNWRDWVDYQEPNDGIPNEWKTKKVST